VAIAAPALALWVAFGGGSHSLALSAVVLGLAISGMHYTATTGLSLYPHSGAAQAPALSPDLLAVLVAIVAFLVSGRISVAAPAGTRPTIRGSGGRRRRSAAGTVACYGRRND
jgi:NO-binding membrane sensor protein with MHYT domain